MQTLRLHDVDVTALAGTIVARSGFKFGADREDAEQYLVIEAWRLAERYDPARGVRFSTFAQAALKLKLIDFQRKTYGRTRWKWRGSSYERQHPKVVSLSSDDGVVAAAVDALATRDGDRQANWDTVVAGLYRDRDRCRARDLELLGLAAPR